MPPIPSSRDVAQAAGVSQSTVSFVLNDRFDISISEATRTRVKRIARRLGYMPNRLAKSLVSGRTQTVGVMIPRLDSSFCGGIAQGIQEASVEHNHRVLIANTMRRADESAFQIDCLLEHQVDGIICVACESMIDRLATWIARCTQAQIPIVVIDDNSSRHLCDCIVSDDLKGALDATEYLIALGHRNIAHLCGSQRVSTGRERLDGYQNALENHGICIRENLVIGESFIDDRLEHSMKQLMRRPDAPTAIFAASDILAAKAIRVLRTMGIRVPEDISMVGYANYEVSAYLELTTVNQNEQQMGRAAFECLMERFDSSDMPVRYIRTPVECVVRSSTQKLV